MAHVLYRHSGRKQKFYILVQQNPIKWTPPIFIRQDCTEAIIILGAAKNVPRMVWLPGSAQLPLPMFSLEGRALWLHTCDVPLKGKSLKRATMHAKPLQQVYSLQEEPEGDCFELKAVTFKFFQENGTLLYTPHSHLWRLGASKGKGQACEVTAVSAGTATSWCH